MCTYGSPRAAVLAGPNIHWGQGRSVDAQDLISKWAAGISTARHTEEVAGSVVDTLLQISANPHLRPFIPTGAWSWLNDRPSLPLTCGGLSSGCDRDIVRTVRALDNTEILTSYLVTVWSEWKLLDYGNFVEMQISVREDFKGIGAGCHRAEVGLHRRRIVPAVTEPQRHPRRRVVARKSRTLLTGYGRPIPRVQEGIAGDGAEGERDPRSYASQLYLSQSADPCGLHRIPLDLHVCPASPVSITSHLRRFSLFEINRFVCSRSIPLWFPRTLLLDLEYSNF